jgi:HAD superfamily hydrolase (TIGR01509 family)
MRLATTPSLLVFDFDGVIADSETLAHQVIANTLSAASHATTLDEALEHYLGRNWAGLFEVFEARWRCKPPPGLRQQVEDGIRRQLPTLAAIPGAVEFIGRTSNLPRCIASSSHPDWIVERLRQFGLEPSFQGAVFSAAVHVERGKPHPDIYLHAMRAMGASPGQTWIIEDSVTGVTGAAASGATVIGLCAGRHCRDGHAERLLAAGADAVCRSFAEVAALLDREAAAQPVSGLSPTK